MTTERRIALAIKVLFTAYRPRQWQAAEWQIVEQVMAANPWLKSDSITSVSVSRSNSENVDANDSVLKIAFVKKLAPESLPKSQRVPKRLQLPEPIGEVTTDIIERPALTLNASNRVWNTRWPETPGTLGAYIYHVASNGQRYPVLLSNAHVLGYPVKGARPQDDVLTGPPAVRVGQWIKSARFRLSRLGDAVLEADAAIALLGNAIPNSFVPGLDLPVVGFGRRPQEGMTLEWTGQKSTGTNFATVTDRHLHVPIPLNTYPGVSSMSPRPNRVFLANHMLLSGASQPGDSGSALIRRIPGGVVLYGIVVGQMGYGNMLACPIRNIKETLNVFP